MVIYFVFDPFDKRKRQAFPKRRELGIVDGCHSDVAARCGSSSVKAPDNDGGSNKPKLVLAIDRGGLRQHHTNQPKDEKTANREGVLPIGRKARLIKPLRARLAQCECARSPSRRWRCKSALLLQFTRGRSTLFFTSFPLLSSFPPCPPTLLGLRQLCLFSSTNNAFELSSKLSLMRRSTAIEGFCGGA